MIDFNVIRETVENRFKEMCEDNAYLYEVEANVDKDVLWNTSCQIIDNEKEM